MIVSGIYKITNIKNKKVYIGSAVNIEKRIYFHKNKLNKNKHENKKLQYSWLKYGEKNFVFEVIEYVKVLSDLIFKEQYYLDMILKANSDCNYFKNNGLNLNPIAGSSLGTKHTLESKIKMSNSKKGERNHFYGSGPMLGRTFTDKHKELIGKSNSGVNNYKSKIVIQYDLEMNLIKEWESTGQAGKILKISQSNICQCCLGFRKKAGNFKWKYK